MIVSVITVTLNSERHLEEAMESVLAQEWPELDYVIVDGGSTDGTLAIVRRLAEGDPRIRWISEPDRGISDAFNKGIALARGELIGILNSDDTYAAGALRAVAEAFAANPECDVFHGDMARFEGDRELFVLKPAGPGPATWHEMPLNHPATFVTRRAYDDVGTFDLGLRVAMDYDLVLRLYRHGCRFHYLPQVLAGMRYGGASDERLLAVAREVYAASVRLGYPRWRAGFWSGVRVGKGVVKRILRRLGLHGVMRLHPRFHGAGTKEGN
ncbi:MAG: glycosyltransferase [Desulfuromonadales bacterium]|nr:MAG: glycosyltransferase [Desulfuromonadales bacterium]